MRKLSTLILLALLASPAFCLPASSGPSKAPTAPSTDVIWIAMGNQPVAVKTVTVAPPEDLVTICYYGVTMRVREKIAERYLRIGATCGPRNQQEGPIGETGPQGPMGLTTPSIVLPRGCGFDGPIGQQGQNLYLAPKASATEKVVQIGK